VALRKPNARVLGAVRLRCEDRAGAGCVIDGEILSGGVAIIRYWGDSHAVAVTPETLSLRPTMSAARPRRTAASDEPTKRESDEIG
jgi:hypothetical protein